MIEPIGTKLFTSASTASTNPVAVLNSELMLGSDAFTAAPTISVSRNF